MAYYLTRHPAYAPRQYRISLVEGTGIACGASGKAGGFFRDFSGEASPLQSFAVASLRQHRELNALLDRRRQTRSAGAVVVDPYLFTHTLMAEAEKAGVRVVHARVTGIECDGERPKAVQTSRGPITADTVIIAMGPWSGQASLLVRLPYRIPVSGYKGNSILMSPLNPVRPQCLFIRTGEGVDQEGSNNGSEIYLFPRHNGQVYIWGPK
ncbi:hypothetical protein BZG36_03724 [Bifiguratus adelaidae]|uniref:FAD dependent oxidoreductase domain-containing protein n=1 Tax=Bifiguratus adelaidae TaxID=1938954 RepID=A0A261XZ40_9FUNG|nr:hypothetical protein BZG36_03724 [Bifiguratus adelaidae]